MYKSCRKGDFCKCTDFICPQEHDVRRLYGFVVSPRGAMSQWRRTRNAAAAPVVRERAQRPIRRYPCKGFIPLFHGMDSSSDYLIKFGECLRPLEIPAERATTKSGSVCFCFTSAFPFCLCYLDDATKGWRKWVYFWRRIF